MKKALSEGTVDIEQTNGAGYTPLLAAACNDVSLDIAKILLSGGANVAASSSNGSTALHVAALFGNIALINLLVSSGARLQAVDKEGRTPLLVATAYGMVQAVDVLARRGSDVNFRASDGLTPLHCAVRQKRLDIVKVLLHARADLTLRFDKLTPLESALSLDSMDIADEIMRCANLDNHLGNVIFKGEEVLQAVAFNDVPGAIPQIFNAGVRDTDGVALCLAVSKRSESCVKALLKQYSDSHFRHAQRYVNGARIDGVGWLSHALRGDKPSARIVRLLVNAGADTTSTIGSKWEGRPAFESNPTQCVATALEADSKEPGVEEAHLWQLKRILQLFHQVPAVHATSWLWPKVSNTPTPTGDGNGKRSQKSGAVVRMLPVLRRRGMKRHVLLASLTR